MIDLYTWSTPNGRKVSIMLEETGLAYRVIPIDIGKGDQYGPEFLEISPNNKIPAIVDHDDDISVMESGAILLYLAEKTGLFMPADRHDRFRVVEWLMFQMGGLGPMLGQAHHFNHYKPDVSDYARQRYLDEAQRLYQVLDRRLAAAAYLAGDEYTIADIAAWPWTTRYAWQGIDLNRFPNVLRWYRSIAQRPAARRGYRVPHDDQDVPEP